MQPFRFFLALVALGIFSCQKNESADEHSTASSLKDLKVYDGLHVELFASEPMFSNPTNISVDSRGRVWVCEAYNYRNALNPKNPVKAEGDRIMILEDTDHDGVADKSKVFYQGTDVNAALGICVLGKKIFVSCSPNVFVFTDENGDDVPDSKEILFTGIRGEQHDHAMHTFTFGHDGRLYFNMGNAADVLLTANKDTVVDIHGRKIWNRGNPFRQGLALRCEPDGSNVEVLAHNFRNNYELTVDPYGTVWQSDNDDDGNKSTRINYVMEQGNFGYTDEMTGAGWNARRTNIEKEIPSRHWHSNDPGVVPNVLVTGSGSPSGMTMYEGTMLPEVFRGQMIHAEPGHNVVRAYPVENDGAGYKATIVNLLEGQKDQWFRPVDVTSGADGSLFVADWYDPGVGGHQVGDLDRGRIYRIVSKTKTYEIPAVDVSTAKGAIDALLNPNTDVRYQGWMALQAMGAKAEPELAQLWKSQNPRLRAQALWLLGRIDGKGATYIDEALTDKNPDIRIAGLRVSRQLEKDFFPRIEKLSGDDSPQVRREVAIALRGLGTAAAAKVWTALAKAYDGKDRWYLEALGIGAALNWDLYFNTWKKEVGPAWNTPVNRDIVWRSRSKDALPMLADLIHSSSEQDMLRYFRAMDFHTDPSKQQILAKLATTEKDSRVLYALKHMDVSKFKMTPQVMATLNRVLDQNKGKLEFVELVSTFKLENRAADLLQLVLQYPDSTSGKEAAKTLLKWKKVELFKNTLAQRDQPKSKSIVKALAASVSNPASRDILEMVMLDSTQDIEVRNIAVRSFRGPWEAEDRLLALAKDKKLPKDLYTAAGGVFQTAYRSSIRDDGAKYLGLPGGKEGKPLSSISVLVDRNGDASKGKEVFKTVCSNCHQVNKEGVNFGPDLSEIGDKLSKQALYTSILYPDQGISFGYEAFQIKLKDGSTAFGRIVSKSEDKIEMQYITNQQTINRADVESMTQLESSLMPSNLQSTMSEEDLVNLVEYLAKLKKQAIAAK